MSSSYILTTHIAPKNLRPDIVLWNEKVPTHIAPTNLRPDIVLWDEVIQLVLLELAIAFVFDAAVIRKRLKYEGISEEAKRDDF